MHLRKRKKYILFIWSVMNGGEGGLLPSAGSHWIHASKNLISLSCLQQIPLTDNEQFLYLLLSMVWSVETNLLDFGLSLAIFFLLAYLTVYSIFWKTLKVQYWSHLIRSLNPPLGSLTWYPWTEVLNFFSAGSIM